MVVFDTLNEMEDGRRTLGPAICGRPPGSKQALVCGPNDVLLDGWEGTTLIDRAAIADCRPDEWLLVAAWDES